MKITSTLCSLAVFLGLFFTACSSNQSSARSDQTESLEAQSLFLVSSELSKPSSLLYSQKDVPSALALYLGVEYRKNEAELNYQLNQQFLITGFKQTASVPYQGQNLETWQATIQRPAWPDATVIDSTYSLSELVQWGAEQKNVSSDRLNLALVALQRFLTSRGNGQGHVRLAKLSLRGQSLLVRWQIQP